MSARHVAVYGLGRVGMPLAAAWLKAGFTVVGVDVDVGLIDRLNSSVFGWIEEPGVSPVFAEAVRRGALTFTSDGRQASAKCDVHLIAVPTPMEWSTKRFQPSPLNSVLETIGSGLKKGDVVIVESSVPPGTTCGPVKQRLHDLSGLMADQDFYLGFSPERIYVGRALEDLTKRYPKVVGGVGPKSAEAIAELYSSVVEKGVIVVRDSTTAEMVKLFEGIYRDVNIALANELALYCERIGLDYYEIREAANSQPYSHLHLPGPGVGGMCIPVYPYFVIQHALQKGFEPNLVRLAREINESMPRRVVEALAQKADELKIDLKKAKLAVLGVAFRGNVSDTRNSPAHQIADELVVFGVKEIVAHDPYVKNDDTLAKLGVPLTGDLAQALSGCSAIVVVADHTQYTSLTLRELAEYAHTRPLIVLDTKNAIKPDIVDGVIYSCLGKAGSSYQCA